jgi:hypothetical protein
LNVDEDTAVALRLGGAGRPGQDGGHARRQDWHASCFSITSSFGLPKRRGWAPEQPLRQAVRTISGLSEEVFPMKRLLIVLVLLVAGVVGLGFYQGWFRVSTGGTDGKTNATFEVDQNKIEADKEKAKEKVQELEQKVKEKTGATTGPSKEQAPRP